MSTEVKVPTLGESVTEATIGEWLKKPGEAVALDEPIASLETDKVAVEVPSPVAGVMGQQLVAVGDTVNVGAAIATIEAGGAAPAPAPPAAPPAPAAGAAAPPPAPPATAAPAGEAVDTAPPPRPPAPAPRVAPAAARPRATARARR
ncbi:biotin/lipoyl-containing protein, partial [Sphingopyxis sp. LC363]|uniref:biotin/lipoyl-containing protein n=1 Tax=Sphingopyxis sp. LC363 TaxID=1120705 RepID=UPI00055FDF5B